MALSEYDLTLIEDQEMVAMKFGIDAGIETLELVGVEVLQFRFQRQDSPLNDSGWCVV